ncbi:NAD(P)-binding domain-containing protein [Polaribacter litorisediminis]|uniref:NAD(P)-binding domain-containing protein n=1 Tax=Polaribacter litorisediminis TaxID=1908341 RepID=UPI001CBEDBAC|nr:NAD(P)-binding domain-containing protein [Polaribacter litorisediminis]UAM99044.1 NAD(P)-binding domain-containing protein [Polaribacter litorisediminis]
MNNHDLPVAIIGGGPVGLSAAAHLKKSNQPFILFETGSQIGANILKWGHVRLFSPWEYNIDKAAETLLREAQLPIPNKADVPYGKELIEDYLKPLANLPGIKKHIHLNSKVISIGRSGLDKMKDAKRAELPFSIQVIENGKFKLYEAKAVIDASGTLQSPNPVGSGGIFALGEVDNRAQIYYGMPDINEANEDKYANKTTLVVGGGHSAIGTILALNDLIHKYPNTKIHWVLRKKQVSDVYGGQEADKFKARGALGIQIEILVNSGAIEIHTPVYIHEIEKNKDQLAIKGLKHKDTFVLEGIDEIISNTGSRPDFNFLREIRFDSDAALESVPKLANLIDPNIHSCGTVRPHGEAELRQKEKDFYIVGMKSYGRAPTFLMTTGYEQIRSIVAFMNGDFESAKRVELNLPETGVCSSGISRAIKETEVKVKTSCAATCGV